MVGPFLANTTADTYRPADPMPPNPPASPQQTAVPIHLGGDWASSHVAQTTSGTTFRYTHVAIAPTWSVIKDGYSGDGMGGESNNGDYDTLFIPDKSGTKYTTIFAEIVKNLVGPSYKRVYLQRQS
jgi:hypothetical protein